MRLILPVIFLSLFVAFNEACAQDDQFDQIVTAVKEGNSKSLAAHFGATVELSLPDHENTYSDSQGEMIMRDFFKKYPPSGCTIIQKGTTNTSTRFAICEFTSGNAQFQLYIHLQKEKDEFLIRKIKFDEKK